MQTTIRKVALFVCALSVGAAVFSGVPAHALQSGGIGGRVANPDPKNPRSQSIFIHTLKRGESTKDQLVVINQTDSKKTISLGSVDGVVTNTGAYTCRQAAEPVKDSGAWIDLSKDEVTLEAGAKQTIDFTITVPKHADVGEHNSCIAMQADEKESDAASGVRLRMRQAIRLVVTIPGDLHREISLGEFTVKNGES